MNSKRQNDDQFREWQVEHYATGTEWPHSYKHVRLLRMYIFILEKGVFKDSSTILRRIMMLNQIIDIVRQGFHVNVDIVLLQFV
jgi:hypothetical protein